MNKESFEKTVATKKLLFIVVHEKHCGQKEKLQETFYM
jgi:hypothetical protein